MVLILPPLLGTQTDLGRGNFRGPPSPIVLKTQKGVDKSTQGLNRRVEV